MTNPTDAKPRMVFLIARTVVIHTFTQEKLQRIRLYNEAVVAFLTAMRDGPPRSPATLQ